MSRTYIAEANVVAQPLKLVSIIAEGHSNTVALVQNPKTQKYTVAKFLNEDRRDLIDSFKSEASLMATLDHPRILKSEGFKESMTITDDEGHEITAAGIEMEHAPQGDLFDLLTAFNELPSFIARSYTKQMVEAVAYLHSKGIAHLDIKLENFLVDAKFNLKLADFGFSRSISSEQLLIEKVGTPDYWSPEQNEDKSYNGFKTDVFSLGMTIFLLVAGRMPFEKATMDDEFYANFYNGDVERFWQMHEEEMGFSSSSRFFKEDFRSLINGMLSANPAERMTIQDVLNQSWLNISAEMVDKCGGVVAEFLKKKCRIN